MSQPFFDGMNHFHGIMGGLLIEKIKRRHEWIKNITAKSYGRKINTWCSVVRVISTRKSGNTSSKTRWRSATSKDLIQQALALPENRGQVSNAFQHIWGYFKKQATAEEKADFMLLLEKYQHGQASQEDLIKGIEMLLERYPNRYLQDSTLLGGE